MNSGIYASYIYTFTLRNQILQGLIKRFYSSACFIGVFFFPCKHSFGRLHSRNYGTSRNICLIY